MTTRVGVPDDGAVVSTPAGDPWEIALPETASTGYRWQLDPLPPGAELLDDRVEPGGPGGGGPGDGGQGDGQGAAGAVASRVFTVRTGQPGTFSARLARAWESTEPVQTFSVQFRPG